MTPGAYLNGLDGPQGDFSVDPGEHAEETTLTFDETRASDFAKSVAGDFNPLHDVGHSRFCVPGDLLFAALVSRYGLHAETSVNFTNMVPARAQLRLPSSFDSRLQLVDERDREVLSWFRGGEPVPGRAFARDLVTEYVRFSGRTFPDLLVPMMREAGSMVNPARPLVMYKDMVIRLDAAAVASGLADGCAVALVAGERHLSVTDKKGAARLQFGVTLNGLPVGDGEKQFVVGGLRPFDEDAVAGLVDHYETRKKAWVSTDTPAPAA